MDVNALPADILADAGGTARLTLPGRGMGGYEWFVTVLDGRCSAKIASHPPDRDGEPRIGAAVPLELVVKMRGDHCKLRLDYRRGWEQQPAASHELTVTRGS